MTLLHLWLLGKSFTSNQIIWALGRSKGDITPTVALALLLLLGKPKVRVEKSFF